LVEGVVVVVVVVLLFAVVVPMVWNPQYPAKPKAFNCVNNLKQIGIAVRIWEGDHDDKYATAVPAALGGAQEMMATGNVVACFEVMSNELSTPKILICAQDAGHRADTNWDGYSGLAWGRLSRTNISYFMGLDAVESDPQAVVSGDANLVQNGRVVGSGIVNLATNVTTWTTNRHGPVGYVLFADGSVQSVTEINSSTSPGGYPATNRLVAHNYDDVDRPAKGVEAYVSTNRVVVP
jgi:prepilin-type processing-associated H-X9-DG protein